MRQLYILIVFLAFIFISGCKEEVPSTTVNVVESGGSPFDVFEGNPSHKVLTIQDVSSFMSGFQTGLTGNSEEPMGFGFDKASTSRVLLGCHNPPCKVETYFEQGSKRSGICKVIHVAYHNMVEITKGMTCSSPLKSTNGSHNCYVCRDELNEDGVCETYEVNEEGRAVFQDRDIPSVYSYCWKFGGRRIGYPFIKGIDIHSPIFFHAKITDREGEVREGNVEIRWE